MKRSIMTVTVLLMVLFAVSCGDDSKNDTDWGNQDNEVNDEDSGDTGDTGNTGNTGDTVDTGNTGNTGDEDPDMSDESGDSDQSDESEMDEDSETQDEDTAVDPLLAPFVGTWAQKIILKSVSSTSLAKNVPSVTTRYILVNMSIKDGKLSIDRKDGIMCQTDNETGDSFLNEGIVGFNEPNSKFNTIYNFWKPSQIPGQESTPDVNITKEGEKVKFVTNKEWELRGANMTNPAAENMVNADNDPRIFDHDGDTKAAFTITFSGFVNGPIYYVQRLTAIFEGEVVAENKIEGHVDWTDEQYAHSSTPNATKGQKTTVTDKEKSVFQFVKVADTMTCSELIAQKATLFDLVNPNTNPDGDPNN